MNTCQECKKNEVYRLGLCESCYGDMFKSQDRKIKSMTIFCFECHKSYDWTKVDPREYGVQCTCGGFIVSPSGRVQMKVEYEDEV
ncbi:hypothetical protein [Bacillus phage Nachito]|nr:hypothetical protein [Bacillus phage Nachito]